nr:RNA-directed DNA polymerase, eukaryota [Tanacetum cinerariifolium]
MDSGKKGDQDGFLDAKVLISNKQKNGYVNCNGESSKRGVSHSPEVDKESHCSGHFRRCIGSPTCGSILDVLDNLIKVCQTMGYKMDGCDIYRGNNQDSWRERVLSMDFLSYNIQGLARRLKKIVLRRFVTKTRSKEERFGTIFNNHNARVFNSFISSSELLEVPLGRCEFTWCHKSGSKMSKLDRFLISEGLMSSCPNILAVTLDRHLSDHRPILLRETSFDYGLILFRMYHFWFKWYGFDKLIQDTRTSINISDNNAMNLFLKKMRYLKDQIKVWRKRNQQAIHGILKEVKWVDDPKAVKDEFVSHFQERFDTPIINRLRLDLEFSKQISMEQLQDLERNVSIEEI